MRWLVIALLVGGPASLAAAAAPLALTSPDLKDGAAVPTRFTCDGENRSPALAWTSPPAGTRSFALVIEDPDTSRGLFRHWAVFDIPATARGLPAALAPDAAGLRQAKNDGGTIGYRGPCPPPGKPHHYHFRLFALDVPQLALGPEPSVQAVVEAAKPHLLAEADLTPVYSRH